jgi:RNA polymerase sigma-70 factor (ECF subfamily)
MVVSVYDRYALRGLRYAYAIVRNPSDAEDVVQEAFCRMLAPGRRREWTTGQRPFAPVFFTTVRHLSIDVLRKRGREVKLVQHGPRSSHEPSAVSNAMAIAGHVRELIELLPATWAEALKLRIDAELSYDEIGRVLGCTRSQVRTWIYRARRRLEDGLRKQQLIASEESA